MKKNYYLKSSILLVFLSLILVGYGQKATFESLYLDPDSYWNGISSSYGNYKTDIQDSIFSFPNRFSRNDYGYGMFEAWNGFAYSRMTDDTTAGFTNQYSAITASGAFGTDNYGICYLQSGSDTVRLNHATKLDSAFFTNGTYPFLAMKNGDMFSKKFGGESGDDPDWFLLSIQGLRNGIPTDTIHLYLADFRDSNNANDYILDEWTKVDLTPLDTIDMIEFSLSSSDRGAWGMNTPAYFCIDNFGGADFDELPISSGEYWNGSSAMYGSYSTPFSNEFISFPNTYSINDYGFGPYESWTGFAYSNRGDDTTAGFTNQYSAITASGVGASYNYGICYNSRGADTIKLASPMEISGLFVTNGTYGVNSMKEGDAFAKKFGGESGDDPDWFLLSIKGILAGEYTDTVEFYLADFRAENNEEDYIITDWTWVDLTELGAVDMIEFNLSSSDAGAYGMNTPAYFFMDDINDQLVEQVNTIADVVVYENAEDEIIDLSQSFSDPDDDDAAIQLKVHSNSNEGLVSAAITDHELTLSFSENSTGAAEISIEAISNERSITSSFLVTVNPGGSAIPHSMASFEVYPNPTSGSFFIGTSLEGIYQIEIFDLFGQTVYSQIHSGSDEEINLESYPGGLYIITISAGDLIITRQIIKE